MTDVAEFTNFEDFDAADTANMTVIVGGRPTSWVWTFSGPGHPKTLDQSNRVSRAALHKQKLMEQAQVNGKKWIAEEETPAEIRAQNVQFVVDRLIGWSDVTIGGVPYPFTAENAVALLSEPSRIALLTQALEFLSADASFTRRSAGS